MDEPSCSLLPIMPPSALRILAALSSSTRPLWVCLAERRGLLTAGAAELKVLTLSALSSPLSRPWLFNRENQFLGAEAPPLLPSLLITASHRLLLLVFSSTAMFSNKKITPFFTRNS